MGGDKIYTYADLVEISNLLQEKNLAFDNLTINIGIKTQKMLDRLNHDFFFYLKPDEKKELDSVNEIIITINGVKFRYYLEHYNDNI